MPRTVHGLLDEAASRRPGALALRDDIEALTFGDWAAASLNLAALMQRSGVRKGDLVGVCCGKTILLPVAFTAVSSLGARFLAVSPDWPETTFRRLLPASPKSILVCFDGPPAHPGDTRRMTVARSETLEGRLKPGKMPDVDSSEDFYMNVTSASTGLPKMARASHEALIANTRGICSALGLTAEDVQMSLFSAHSHPHELFMRGLLLGGATVLTEGRYPRTAMDLIADAGVTVLMGLPPQLDGLARSAGRERRSLSRLRLAEAGGMHSSQTFLSRFHDLSGVDAVAVWGSAETSGVALYGDPNREGLANVVEGYSVELDDPSGNVVSGDSEGELRVSGTPVVNGYQGDRMSTEEFFRDGWFLTGDVFRRESGVLHFLGRRGGLIKSAGLKVFPLEVELAVLRHPDVLDAAVYGEEQPGRGETVVARVVLRPGAELPSPVLREFLRGLLDAYKIPRKFLFVPDLPRTPSGKIDRAALGSPPSKADWKGELLRTDVEIVRLINHRASAMALSSAPFDPSWVEEQLDNAVGHNNGSVSDDTVRSIMSAIIHSLADR